VHGEKALQKWSDLSEKNFKRLRIPIFFWEIEKIKSKKNNP